MDESLSELRARALSRHRAARNKVLRMERKVWGGHYKVKLQGSKYDPVRDPKLISRYNKQQLNAYIAKLDAFVSRKTQFVPDMRGRPIPNAAWRDLAKTQQAFNNSKLSRAAAVGGYLLPPIVTEQGTIVAQQTVKERRDNLPDKPRRNSNPAVNNPWMPKDYKPWQVSGEGAMNRLEKMLRDRMSPEGQQKEYEAQLTAARKMLKDVGAPDLIDRVQKMNMQQFYILFNHSGFVEELATDYWIIKDLDPAIEANFNDMKAQAHGNAKRLIGWAEKQQLGG